MAKTAAVTLERATGKPGQVINGLVTISNTDANPMAYSKIVVSLSTNQQCASIKQPDGAGGSGAGTPSHLTVPSFVKETSGSLAVPFSLVAHAPTWHSSDASNAGPPATIDYVVGATVTMSDGSIIAATTATVTISPPA